MNILKSHWLKVLAVLFILIILISFLWGKNNKVFCRMSVNLYEDSFPREMSLVDKLEAGKKIRVKKKRLPWVLVQDGAGEGWLPEWYLVKKPTDVLAEIPAYLMVVKEETPLYLYPDCPIYRYYPDNELETLEPGVVVKVENEFDDWRYVRFVTHTIPHVTRCWIKSNSLAKSNEVTPRQGRIVVGTRIYLGDGNEENITNLPAEICDLNENVNIRHEKGDMVYVFVAGGRSFWVNKKDIILDPFLE